jgi:hypothetical protein
MAYAEILILAKDIHRTFGLGSYEIKRRASFLGRNGDVTIPYTSPLNYVLDYLDLRKSDRPYGGCVFVIPREFPQGEGQVSRDNAVEAVKWFVQGGGVDTVKLDSSKIAIEVIKRREKYFLIGARIPLEGCPKSFMNPYILTAEAQYLESRIGRRTGQVQIALIGQKSSRFMIRHKVSGSLFPLNLMVELSQIGRGAVQASVFSNQLRNYSALLNGYWRVQSVDWPTLIFKRSGQREKFSYVLFPGALGKGLYSTPWPAKEFKLPPGEYRLSLNFDKGEVAYDLAENFTVR